jgi:hypothetical protein
MSGLRILTDAMLKKLGVKVFMDRAKMLEAARLRSANEVALVSMPVHALLRIVAAQELDCGAPAGILARFRQHASAGVNKRNTV